FAFPGVFARVYLHYINFGVVTHALASTLKERIVICCDDYVEDLHTESVHGAGFQSGFGPLAKVCHNDIGAACGNTRSRMGLQRKAQKLRLREPAFQTNFIANAKRFVIPSTPHPGIPTEFLIRRRRTLFCKPGETVPGDENSRHEL